MHYLVKKIKELNEDEQSDVIEQIISEVTAPVKTKVDQFGIELLSDYTEAAVERFNNFGKMQGTSTGYKKLDDLTKGLVPGELIIVAGKTSYGKTTLAINIANRVAKAGTPVLFVTLEMTKAEIASRFMSINKGNTSDYEKVSSLIAVQTSNELDWKSIDGLVQNFTNQFSNGLIIIDHLHYFTRELANVAEDLGRVTKELKKNAGTKGREVPIILISHVRKTAGGEAAGIDDLRGSSYIAQDADIVLMVGRDAEDQTKLFVKIEKNRNRGFDYQSNVADMFMDGITIYDNQVVDVFPKNRV